MPQPERDPPLDRPVRWQCPPADRSEQIATIALKFSAAVPVLLSAALVGLLLHGVWAARDLAGVTEGLASQVLGTAVVAGLATLLAVPGGLLAAIYLAEFSGSSRRWLKPVLELLAGVPTIVYALVAVMVVGPLLHRVLPGVAVHSGITAALVLALMILPTISSLSDDALRAVPRELREAALALGASRLRMLRVVVVPAAGPGIVAAVMLAVSRALGETMIMTLVAGEAPSGGLDPRAAVETLTSYSGRLALGGVDDGGLYAAGAALLGLSAVVHMVADRLIRRRGRWS